MLSAEFACDLPHKGWLNPLTAISLSHLPYRDRYLHDGDVHLQSLPSSKFANIKTQVAIHLQREGALLLPWMYEHCKIKVEP